MQHLSIPTRFFPSTTLLIDDSRDFLLNFVLQLDEGLACKIYDSPFDALEYLNQERCELDLLNKRCLTEYTEAKNCPLTNHTINLDLAAVHAEIYNPLRFSEISVVVVDYMMPGMDGLELCRQISNPNIKKILLTGQADEKLVIDAFNEGVIHRYVKKSDANAAELITKNIYELQYQYFQSMSNMIVRMLSVSSPSCLQDKNYQAFFKDLLKEKNIVEYYMADNSGSFLMLDEDAGISFLIVRTQDDLRLYYDFALDNGAPEDVLEQIVSGGKIPCFWTSNSLAPQWSEWAACMVPAKVFTSDEKYYYAYIQGSALFDVRQEKILSYHRYLEDLDAEELLTV